MENSTEPSSSLSFTSSSRLSNGSSSCSISPLTGSEEGASLEVVSLSKLSCNLEQLLVDSKFDYSDAEINVEEVAVGVNRCILAARSKFFHNLFTLGGKSSQKESKPQYFMRDLVPNGRVGYEAFKIFLSYLYTGKLKPSPPEVSTCVDTLCAHDACGPAINFVVELMYASSTFEITELVSLFQRRLLNFVEKALVEDVIPIIQVAFYCQMNQLVIHCVHRLARSDLDSITIEKELPHEVVENIKLLRLKSQSDDDEPNLMDIDPVQEKSFKRIHKALDSDDVELVKLLLTESNVSLDDVNALHYAVTYCDPKIVAQVLDLGLANVNLRNSRGYTVLHMAAMRKEPSIIVSLLTKGACATETTLDGRSPVRICCNLTRPKDYHAKTKQGQEANKDRLCIDILEREIRRNPMSGEGVISSASMTDDLHMKLLHLENRVAFARLFFPSEAKVAMQIANADITSEFTGLSPLKTSSGNLREVDLNETPTMRNKRLSLRMEALQKTVELGRRYFPHISDVLDKFMEDDLPDLFFLEKGTPDEQKIKRAHFMELKEDFKKAFKKDKAKFSNLGLSSPLPSSFVTDGVNYKVRKKYSTQLNQAFSQLHGVG